MFDFNSLSRQGGASPAPVLYTYYTSDDMDVVAASGYFNEAYTWLKVDDLIRVVNTKNVYDLLVTSVGKKSVVIARLSKVGWASYYDTATQATPISMLADTWYDVPNNGLGTSSSSAYLPYGYTDVWNASAGQFESSDLKLGDSVDLQLDLTWTSQTGNSAVEIELVLTEDGVDYSIPYLPETAFKSTGEHRIIQQKGVFFENELSLSATAKFRIRADAASSFKVNSFYVRLYLNG